jgi:hypothetical protein
MASFAMSMRGIAAAFGAARQGEGLRPGRKLLTPALT